MTDENKKTKKIYHNIIKKQNKGEIVCKSIELKQKEML